MDDLEKGQPVEAEIESGEPKEIRFVSGPRTERFLRREKLDRPVRVQELLDRGYVLQNQIGQGERAIVQTVGGEDISDEAFLTREQLRKHLEENVPEGMTEEEVKRVGQQMEKFIYDVQKLTVANELLNPESRGANRIRNMLVGMRSRFDDRFPELEIERRRQEQSLGWETDVADVTAAIDAAREKYQVPEKLGGIEIDKFERRGEGNDVDGHSCPHLECDHVFLQNAGIKINDDGSITGKPGQIRVNSVVAHLAEHGISNNGEAKDWTQRYMTIREFLPIAQKLAEQEFNRDSIDAGKLVREVAMVAADKMLNRLGIRDELTDEQMEEMADSFMHFEIFSKL